MWKENHIISGDKVASLDYGGKLCHRGFQAKFLLLCILVQYTQLCKTT